MLCWFNLVLLLLYWLYYYFLLLSSEQDKADWIKVNTARTLFSYLIMCLKWIMSSVSPVYLIFFFFFFFQAFHETIEIFQQKNESFKNALKDVEEVSVSVVPDLHACS